MSNEKHNKISYRLSHHFSHLQKLFGGTPICKTNSYSGDDGRFDIIRIFLFSESQDAHLGIRIKDDCVDSSEMINLYLLKRYKPFIKEDLRYNCHYKPPIFSLSKDMTYNDFCLLMKQFLSCNNMDDIIYTLNNSELFDFDVNIFKLSTSEFYELFINAKNNNDHIFDSFCGKLINLKPEFSNELNQLDKQIKNEETKLSEDLEYISLLKERERIELAISQKEKNKTQLDQERNSLNAKLNIVSYFISSKEEIDNDKKLDFLTKRERLDVVIQDMIYRKSFSILNFTIDDLPKSLKLKEYHRKFKDLPFKGIDKE